MPSQLPSYQVVVLSPTTGAVTAIFDPATFLDLRYSRLLNGIGILTLTLPYTNAFRSAFVTDALIDIYRTNPLTGDLALEDTYFARSFNRYRQNNEEYYVVAGVHLNDLVSRRVVDPADDINAAGGYSTYAGPADTVLWQYALFNLGASASALRRVPNLTIPTPPGTGTAVGYRLRFDDLFKIFQDATARGNTDFVIRRTNGAAISLNISLQGSDKRQSSNYPFLPWVALDPRRGNLTDPNLLFDRKSEKNVAYTLGAGQDVNRQIIRQIDTAAGDSPFNRIEYVENASSVAKGDSTGLLTAARTSLKAKAAVTQFTSKLLGTENGAVYQSDLILGDLITVQYDDYVSDLRFTGIDIFISGSQGEVMQPAFTII